MHDSNNSNLMHFLSEPRSLKEVAKHFGISPSLADYHLTKAIEQKRILVCKCPSNANLNSKKKKQRETLFYISKDSHLLANELTGFTVTRTVKAQGVGNEITFIKFDSEDASKSNFSVSGKNNEPDSPLFPRIEVRREKLLRSGRRNTYVARQPLKKSQTRRFSTAEKLSMLTALSRQLLSYLDLKARFNVSKYAIKTFIKKELIEEKWGPKNIGIRFRLTKKGERYLERLKMAAKLEKDKIRKANIQLKHNTI